MSEQESSKIIIAIVVATGMFLFLGIFVMIFFLLYRNRQQRHQKEKSFMESKFQQELLQAQIEIQEQTLKTISQEIHDNIGQVLSLAKLNLNTFENTENIINQTKIIDTKNLVSKAIRDLRDLSRSLHADKFADLGLQESIANELKNLQNTGQYQTHFKVSGVPFKIEPQKEIMLFRIVQEAIHNAVKHAKAKIIDVHLRYEAKVYFLQIADDGIGFNVADLQSAQTGIGLKNMQNRATLIGGIFTINSSPTRGTEINIEVKR